MLLGACAGAQRRLASTATRRCGAARWSRSRRSCAPSVRRSRRRTGRLPLELFGTPGGRDAPFHSPRALGTGEVGAALCRTLCGRSGARSTAIAVHAITPSDSCGISGAEIEWSARSVSLVSARTSLSGGAWKSRATFRLRPSSSRPRRSRRAARSSCRDVGRQSDPHRAARRAARDGRAHRVPQPANALRRARARTSRSSIDRCPRPSIGPEVALRAIDEIPLLAIAAAFARARPRLPASGDLRTKESDRIAAIERLLDAVGIEATSERRGSAIRAAARVARESRRDAPRSSDRHGGGRVGLRRGAAGNRQRREPGCQLSGLPRRCGRLRDGLSGRLGALGPVLVALSPAESAFGGPVVELGSSLAFVGLARTARPPRVGHIEARALEEHRRGVEDAAQRQRRRLRTAARSFRQSRGVPRALGRTAVHA